MLKLGDSRIRAAMRFGAGRGRVGLAMVCVCGALIGAGAAIAGSLDTELANASSVTRVEDDPDAEIPSESLDFLLAPDDADVELLPYLMSGRETLENVRFDIGDEFI